MKMKIKIPAWAENAPISEELKLSVLRSMKINYKDEVIIHCECGNHYGCKVNKIRYFFKIKLYTIKSETKNKERERKIEIA